ncbi:MULTISPECIES: nitrogen regulation protein NR(II) [Anaeromyxobacter]|uniref:two-component system sensor histidine kinase NtrB n=1 Tax=Anaeromyxobacter TaxID=161492 RepID=UPI001F55F65D|nr:MULTISPECIES: HAMP domain-containing sensor histidine kinase [unclassified Anaeromyxobacter]
MPERLDAARWRRVIAANVECRWKRTRWFLFAGFYAVWLAFCAALAATGYPPWRVAVLAGILGALLLSHVARALSERVANACEGDERQPFAFIVIAIATTGGLHSPVLIALMGAVSQFTIRRGICRATLAALTALVVLVAAMFAVPQAWLGPVIPDPLYSLSALGFLLVSVVLHTDYMSLLARTVESTFGQIFRSREEIAAQALARARELELLSSKLSHELRNPLGAIKALVQLSAREANEPEIRERLQVVEGEVERIQKILQEYLSFSRPLDTLRPEPVALGAVADEALAVLEARAESAGVSLRRQGDAELVADPRRLKEALLNLVANAIEATPRKGRVEIEIGERDGQVRVEVSDTGRGMPPEVLDRVGTPFFTTREEGTGLGVLLARGVFVQHGGALEYRSVPGQGTVASASLPREPTVRCVDAPLAARG